MLAVDANTGECPWLLMKLRLPPCHLGPSPGHSLTPPNSLTQVGVVRPEHQAGRVASGAGARQVLAHGTHGVQEVGICGEAGLLGRWEQRWEHEAAGARLASRQQSGVAGDASTQRTHPASSRWRPRRQTCRRWVWGAHTWGARRGVEGMVEAASNSQPASQLHQAACPQQSMQP